jgi:hypothetical protein
MADEVAISFPQKDADGHDLPPRIVFLKPGDAGYEKAKREHDATLEAIGRK